MFGARSQRRLVIVLSGPVASGKSTLATRLSRALEADVLKTRPILEEQYFIETRLKLRQWLQELGETLDEETGGRWVAAAAERQVRFAAPRRPLIVDSVRRAAQIEALSDSLDADVIHIHVDASVRTLERRYEARRMQNAETELESYQR